MQVTLFHYQDDTIKITVEAYFNAQGDLVVEGYDIGKKVTEYWGDSDYEYSTTVTPAETAKLYTALGIPQGLRNDLLMALQRRFHTNSCYSEFQALLDHHGIRYEGFSWR